jgi:hypothetical protein
MEIPPIGKIVALGWILHTLCTVFAVLDSYISVLNTTSTPGQLNENNESYLPAEVNLYSVTFIIDLLIVSLCLFTSE